MTDEAQELLKKGAIAAFNCALSYAIEVDGLEDLRVKPEEGKKATKVQKFLSTLADLAADNQFIDQMSNAYKRIEEHARLSSDSKLSGRSNEAYLQRLEAMSLLSPELYRAVLNAQKALYDALDKHPDLLEELKDVYRLKQGITDGTAAKFIGEGSKLAGFLFKAAGVGAAGGPVGVGVTVGLAVGGVLASTGATKYVEHREKTVTKKLDESEKEVLSLFKTNMSETFRIGARCQPEYKAFLDSAAAAVDAGTKREKCREIQSDVVTLLDHLPNKGEIKKETLVWLKVENGKLAGKISNTEMAADFANYYLSKTGSPVLCGIKSIDDIRGNKSALHRESQALSAHLKFLEERRNLLTDLIQKQELNYQKPVVQGNVVHKKRHQVLNRELIKGMLENDEIGALGALRQVIRKGRAKGEVMINVDLDQFKKSYEKTVGKGHDLARSKRADRKGRPHQYPGSPPSSTGTTDSSPSFPSPLAFSPPSPDSLLSPKGGSQEFPSPPTSPHAGSDRLRSDLRDSDGSGRDTPDSVPSILGQSPTGAPAHDRALSQPSGLEEDKHADRDKSDEPVTTPTPTPENTTPSNLEVKKGGTPPPSDFGKVDAPTESQSTSTLKEGKKSSSQSALLDTDEKKSSPALDEIRHGQQMASRNHYSFFQMFTGPHPAFEQSKQAKQHAIAEGMMAVGFGGVPTTLYFGGVLGGLAYSSALIYDQVNNTQHVADFNEMGRDWLSDHDHVQKIIEVAGGIAIGLLVVGIVGAILADVARRGYNNELEADAQGLKRGQGESDVSTAILDGGYQILAGAPSSQNQG